ncbi:MAG: CvpA family protein [Candidatus Omnitrophica bacterium]|nr:CvpA family protein [Candidatus Omnitrophota bacterium]
MLKDILLKINWVDLLALFILLRASYVGIASGFSKELFKLLGLVFAVCFSMHYFTALSDISRKYITTKSIPLDFLDFISFVILAISGYCIFVLIRITFERFIKMEEVPVLSRLGGVILGLARGFLLTSLIMFCLFISTISNFKRNVVRSLAAPQVFKIAPATYRWVWNNIASKFTTSKEINDIISVIETNLKK